jgi:hypothetical protein
MDGNNPRYDFDKPGGWPNKTVKSFKVNNATMKPFENNYQGKKSTRYRLFCEDNICLDLTFSLAAQIQELGLKDGDDLKIGSFKTSDGKLEYKLKTEGGGNVKPLPSLDLGFPAADGGNRETISSLEIKVHSLEQRITALEGGTSMKKSDPDADFDDIPF